MDARPSPRKIPPGTGERARDAKGRSAQNTGDLWIPHVYMPAQNPWGPPGYERLRPLALWTLVQPDGTRPVNGLPVGCIEMGPVPNPYHQAACDLDPPGPGCTAPWEPPLTPGTPNPSIPGRSVQRHTDRERNRLPAPARGAQGPTGSAS